MKGLFGKERMAYFVGGVVLSAIGSALTKNGKVRKLAVTGLSKGMKLQDDVVNCYEGLKEEAMDLYAEAQEEYKKDAFDELFDDEMQIL